MQKNSLKRNIFKFERSKVTVDGFSRKIPRILISSLVLYIDVSKFEKVALTDYTIYTQSINNNTEYYPFGSSGIEDDFFQALKRWVFKYLDTRHHEVSLVNIMHTLKVVVF